VIVLDTDVIARIAVPFLVSVVFIVLRRPLEWSGGEEIPDSDSFADSGVLVVTNEAVSLRSGENMMRSAKKWIQTHLYRGIDNIHNISQKYNIHVVFKYINRNYSLKIKSFIIA
jgi:hypothetical protein